MKQHRKQRKETRKLKSSLVITLRAFQFASMDMTRITLDDFVLDYPLGTLHWNKHINLQKLEGEMEVRHTPSEQETPSAKYLRARIPCSKKINF